MKTQKTPLLTRQRLCSQFQPIPIQHDPNTIWCHINTREKLKKLIENLTDKTLSEQDINNLIEFRTVHEMWDRIGIRWRGRSKREIEDEIERMKDSGEYYRRLKEKFPQGIYNPNIMCLVAQKHLPKSKYLKGWQVVKLLGSGKFGTIFLIQKGTKLRAVKIMFPSYKDWTTPVEEFHLQQKAARIGIAPKVLNYSKHSKFGRTMYVIIMDTMDMDLVTYLKCISTLVKPKERKEYLAGLFRGIRTLFFKMKRHNFTHGDLHPGNIMLRYTSDGKTLEVLLIDFGQSSSQINYPWVDVSQFLRVLQWDFKEMYPQFKQFFNQLLRELYPDKNKTIAGTDDEFYDLHDIYNPYIGYNKK